MLDETWHCHSSTSTYRSRIAPSQHQYLLHQRQIFGDRPINHQFSEEETEKRKPKCGFKPEDHISMPAPHRRHREVPLVCFE
jgi:hypothetical protein